MASSLSSSSPPGLVPFGLPSPASSLDHPLQSPTSAFRPIAPSGDSFFLSAIHTLVLSSPGADDTLSESNASSDKGCSDDLSTTSTAAHLLCQVCSDRASGFHYGVFACEGCKGFFRRSIQQKIQYRPCSRSQECLIVRNNRNRCQYCRLKKCISVGMSRDAVRFGRVPKREKAKMVEDMQRTTAQSQLDAVAVQFESDTEAADRIQHAFSQLVVTLEASCRPVPGRCPVQFHSYLLAIKAVVDFANAIPGFLCLPQTERIALLKGSVLDVLLFAWSASPQSSQWLPSSLLLSQSLLHFSRRVRLLPSPASPAILASLCVVQPLPTQPLALRLSERLWMLLARIGGAPSITAAPVLLSDVRMLRMCHNEFLRAAPAPPPSTPLTVSVTPPEATPSQKSYRERHPSIASLLEKPVVNINLLSPASSGGLGSFCESEDEPLNLCLRDS